MSLPKELLELLATRNGGYVNPQYNAFPVSTPNSWASDHIPFEDLLGVGKSLGCVTILDTPDLLKEWGLLLALA